MIRAKPREGGVDVFQFSFFMSLLASTLLNIAFERVSWKSERVNERVKNELQILYSIIEDNPLIKISSIEKLNKKSNATNRRYLKILKDSDLIEYVGSDKIGGYRIVIHKNYNT